MCRLGVLEFRGTLHISREVTACGSRSSCSLGKDVGGVGLRVPQEVRPALTRVVRIRPQRFEAKVFNLKIIHIR